MKKKIIIAVFGILCVVLILGICYNILFPTYLKLNDNENDIKCIKIESYNKRQDYTFEDSSDIKMVMDYLCSLEYRKPNICEKIVWKIKSPYKIATKTGYKISLYASKECEEADLIMVIEINNGNKIKIDDKVYKLSDKELEPYNDLYDIIHSAVK